MIEIEVPATSANIGPGFDCLGIALSLSNTVRVEKASETRLKGCPPQWAGSDNLFLRSFRQACALLQTSVPEIEVEFITRIPPARGLGSSASLAVAGAAAALLLYAQPKAGTELDILKEQKNQLFLLKAATAVEGHPDNAAPAIYGGFTAAAIAKEDISIIRADAPAEWRFAACIPDFDLETSVARKALPDVYSRADVVHAISHAVLTALAIRNADISSLGRVCEDRIHEPYRRPLVPDFEDVENACRANGAAAVWLSGSGPTILAVFESSVPAKSLASDTAAHAKRRWQVVPLHADNMGLRAQISP